MERLNKKILPLIRIEFNNNCRSICKMILTLSMFFAITIILLMSSYSIPNTLKDKLLTTNKNLSFYIEDVSISNIETLEQYNNIDTINVSTRLIKYYNEYINLKFITNKNDYEIEITPDLLIVPNSINFNKDLYNDLEIRYHDKEEKLIFIHYSNFNKYQQYYEKIDANIKLVNIFDIDNTINDLKKQGVNIKVPSAIEDRIYSINFTQKILILLSIFSLIISLYIMNTMIKDYLEKRKKYRAILLCNGYSYKDMNIFITLLVNIILLVSIILSLIVLLISSFIYEFNIEIIEIIKILSTYLILSIIISSLLIKLMNIKFNKEKVIELLYSRGDKNV